MVSTKIFSIASAVLFLFLLLPLAIPATENSWNPLSWLSGIFLLFPVVMGIWGVLLANLGTKGIVRILLITGNAAMLLFYLVALVMDLVGL